MQRIALVSVWDKTGLAELARCLEHHGYRLLSTSGSAETIRSFGVEVTDIAEYTGSGEILGGRVKTLHPRIAGGILSTRKDPGVEPIDIVVCNLYPFQEGIRRNATGQELIELIDIGGVTLLRAAAKNCEFVLAVPGPEYYPRVITELEQYGEPSRKLRLDMAAVVFRLTSQYDAAIADWFAGLSAAK